MHSIARCAVLGAALVAVGCASGGGGGPPLPPQQLLPVALRGQTFKATAATYSVPICCVDYAVLRDMDDPRGTTTVTTSPGGESFHISVNETLSGVLPVTYSQSLTLPRQGSTSSPNLSYPAANSRLSYMSFGEWLLPRDQSIQGGFFAFGSVTPGPAIPVTGGATYNGAFHARAFKGSLLGVTTNTIDGSVTATADFGARTVSLSTTNAVDPSYNLRGTLNYANGTNVLRGGSRPWVLQVPASDTQDRVWAVFSVPMQRNLEALSV